MKIHRLIYRLDYPTSYELMDRPGEVAKILEATRRGLFDDIGETGQWRATTARSSNVKGTSVEMTVDPKSIVAVMERVDGVDPAKLAETSLFDGITAVMDEFCRVFKLGPFTRGGFRLFILESIGVGPEAVRAKCLQSFGTDVSGAVIGNLGEIRDVGFNFDGQSADKISFHCRFGPYVGKSEVERYFPKTGKDFPEKTIYDLIFDIDQYEENFSYSAATSRRWWRPLAKNAEQVVDSVAKALARLPGA
jgi:hypothetical protein